jgi:phosphate transport system substrate-binding protein
MIAQNGDLGVAGYVSQGFANGAIGYVEYSYALNARFPVAKMLNAAHYYTEPTPKNVAVSLLQAQIDTTDTDPSLYLTQKLDNVYTDPDPRTYPLSSYSYMIIPTTVQGSFSTAKGKTLAAFTYFSMCQGQQEMGSIGYSPMPVNLVQDSFNQIRKIPGAVVQNINVRSCNNPTFTPSGANLLAIQDPLPPACDKQGTTQCATGTGGDLTASVFGSSAGSGSGSGGSAGSGGANGSGGSGSGSGGSAGGAANGGTGSAASRVRAGLGPKVGSARTGSAGTIGSGGNGSSASTVQCNPDTGQCSSAGGTAGALADASPNAITIGPRGSTLYILVGLGCLLVLGIILVPGLLSRYVKVEKK